jgi:prophage regulatory protein
MSKILRLPQASELIGLKKTIIYQMEAEARFPKRVKIGARAVGWLEDELRAWLADRIAARR